MAFHSSPTNNRCHHRQNNSGATAAASTKLCASSLAISFEQDLAMTLQIIMDHQECSATVSKEQFIQQMEEIVAKQDEAVILPSGKVEIRADEVDTSVPYDAAARLAYASLEDKGEISYDAFQTQYLVDAVALVKSKQQNKEGGSDVSPSTAAFTANTSKNTMLETNFEVAYVDATKKPFLQLVISWVWNKISRK